MTRCALERTRWSYVWPALVCWFPIAAFCQQPSQTRREESLLGSIVLFAFLGVVAAVTAIAVRMVRRWR